MRRWNWVIVGLLAMITITTALMARRSTAQEEDWSAILYSSDAISWRTIRSDGSGQPFELAAEASHFAVNNSATRLAYCGMDASGHAIFHLYDLDQQTDLLTTDLGPAVWCQVDHNAFTPDGTRVWVGLAGDPTANQPEWQLVEVQVSDGTVINTLDSENPLANMVESTGVPMMAHVLAADGERVVFGIAPDGIIGAPDMPAYRWIPPSDLSTVTGWGESGADGLVGTKEIIWPELDATLPVGVPSDFLPAYNAVQYLDANGLQIPIYHSPDWLIRDVAWVNGGRQVAIGLISPDEVTPTQVRWVLVNRNGIIQAFDPAEADRITVMDSRDGFAVLTSQLLETGEYHYTLTRYVGDTGQEVLSLDDSADWQLRWVTPSTPAANLSPFIPFLIVPTMNSLPSATPTAGFTNTPTLGATSTPSHIAVTASFTPSPTFQQAATTSSVRTVTPIQPTNTPSITNTRAPSTAVSTTAAPTATGGIRPPSSRTRTPTPTSSGSNPTATQIRPPASPTLPILPASNTPRPSNTSAATTVRPTATTSAPGVAPTSTLRRGQLGSSPTPNTGPTTRPASSTPRPSSTATPAPTNTRTPTFTPSRTPTRTPTRTPSMTFTPTRVVVPSKTPLPTTSGLPTKAPISGPTSTLSYGANQTRLLITNMAGTDLCEIYFTPNTETTWGDNYLEDGAILANGATMVWIVDPAIYDVKVFDCFSNSLEEFGFDLTDGSMEIRVSSSSMTGVPQ
ncbi:MAG: hypothetical protein BroJett018_53480 [Chloroflexota bacterium]|nr:MAG: hypothetical protein BroJett018_53480 [Chloroflexota bacterium]